VGVQAEIVIPVRNEERNLAPSVRRLHAYLGDRFPFSACITIADNGSTDGTITVPVLGDPSPPGPRSRPGDRQARRHGQLASQLGRFIVVGVASTVAYVLLYLLLRGVMGAQAANALSLLATAVANTAANRRLTFGIRGRSHAGRHQLRGLIAFAIGLAITSGALAALHAITAQPARAIEVIVLVAANLVATVVRFALYRSWVFRGHGGRAGPPARQASAPERAAGPETTPI
jgi:putative flippase GtrA